MDFITQIKGHTLEFVDDGHIYLVDGEIVPSITQILKCKHSDKYSDVASSVLARAAEKGIALHNAIEDYNNFGTESDLPEFRNFLFLKKQYKFEVLESERPLILFYDGKPVAAGRCDMVINMDGKLGLADIKRTSALDKIYLADQLNLYRLAMKQSFGFEADFLRGIHLREDVRKFVPIPINEDMAQQIIKDYLEGKYDTENQQ